MELKNFKKIFIFNEDYGVAMSKSLQFPITCTQSWKLYMFTVCLVIFFETNTLNI